jgi:hypothetical protein
VDCQYIVEDNQDRGLITNIECKKSRWLLTFLQRGGSSERREGGGRWEAEDNI